MIRHGGSHGLAVLICTLSSSFLYSMIKTYLPDILDLFSKMSLFFCSLFHLPYPPKFVELILISASMAMIWGIAFSFIHKDNK